MDVGVLIALITAATSLLIAAASLWLQQREARQARQQAAKAVLDRYRGPLLSAAWELGDRIDNIRHRDFLDFAAAGGGRASAVGLTTLFRFAQFFGWREVLRTEVQLLKFSSELGTKRVAALIDDTNWAFATDLLDQTQGMVWTEEQRAIGELMKVDRADHALTCRGYADFVHAYETVFRPWMDDLAQAVLSPDALSSDRLRLLQWALRGLVTQLDEEDVRDARHLWLVRVDYELEEPRDPSADSDLERRVRAHLHRSP